MIPKLIFSLILMLIATTGSRAAALVPIFSHQFNLYGNWSQYLQSAVNAEVYSERQAGSATFWRPTVQNTVGVITYRFPLPNSVNTATLAASMAVWTTGDVFAYDPGAQAYLDVSKDGATWHNLDGRYANQGGGSYGPYDISPYVAGSNEIWVKARITGTRSWYSDGLIFSQFLRTSLGSGDDVFSLQATLVPELSTPILCGGIVLILLIRRRKADLSSSR